MTRTLSFTVLLLILTVTAAGAQAVCDGAAAVDATGLKTVDIVTGLGSAVWVDTPPGETGGDPLNPDRLFIVEQEGVIKIHKRGLPPGATTTFLDISAKVNDTQNEQGLLGLAFDPDFESNGYIYVNYTEGALFGPFNTAVERYKVSAGNPDVADPASACKLMTFPQPSGNHNGGQLLTGPDGFLYVFTGDGGGSNDQGSGHSACGNGQDTTNLLGKILRIDPSVVDDTCQVTPGGFPSDCGGLGIYALPDNPLRDGAGGDCDEIYAYGLRNPWRNSFDEGDCGTETCAMYVADVGQNCLEEINYVDGDSPGGENYGWRQMEGTHFFRPSDASNCNPGPACEECAGYPMCSDTGARILPVHEYANLGFPNDCSVTGGIVYRGCLLDTAPIAGQQRSVPGTYFFGDNCSGRVSSFRVAGGADTESDDWTAEFGTAGISLTSFGTNVRDELLIVDRAGIIKKILPLFPDLIVSGPGAGTELSVTDTSIAWQDLEFATEHPVDSYRVYRGVPGGDFSCVHASVTTEWVGGDPDTPLTGELFGYVVTAVSGAEETSPGTATDGTPRNLLASACP